MSFTEKRYEVALLTEPWTARTVSNDIHLCHREVAKSPISFVHSDPEWSAMLFVMFLCKLSDGLDFLKVPNGIPESSKN